MIQHRNRLESFGIGDQRRELVPQPISGGVGLTIEGVERFEIADCGCRTDWVLTEWVIESRVVFGWVRFVRHRQGCAGA